jgi:hypothetical protein
MRSLAAPHDNGCFDREVLRVEEVGTCKEHRLFQPKCRFDTDLSKHGRLICINYYRGSQIGQP